MAEVMYHEEEPESSEEGLDFDALAEQAVKSLDKDELAAVSTMEEDGELFLDIGVGPESLYMTAESSSSPQDSSRQRARSFDTAALMGVSRLDAQDFVQGLEPKPPPPSAATREVRGEKIRPVDDAKLRQKERRKEREEHLDGWFGLTKKRMTPELEKELEAIQLRGYFDSKRFYKANNSDKLPTHFHIAKVVGGGMAPTGEKPNVESKGRSVLDQMLRDYAGQEFTERKMAEHTGRVNGSKKSGHGNPRPKGRESQKRRGNWKKTTKRGKK
mmetsp:Transcript_44790/g.106317  ORF Transcript_44790/g.106317 Transcript_44790/m.106317 type:complete len:272 (-) Transcript_44790:57-872(-)